jgi:polygalacturonase
MPMPLKGGTETNTMMDQRMNLRRELTPPRILQYPTDAAIGSFRTFAGGLLILLCSIFVCDIQAHAQRRSPQTRAAKLQLSIVDHGAVGDGETLNTEAIQRTIDTCSKKGGGTVRIPAGRFVTGTILIKDNVTLYLDEGAMLLGSLSPGDYRNVDPFKDGLGAEVGFAMVAAVDAKNIAIAGRGAINGRGKEIAEGMPFKGEGWGGRPFLLRFVRSTNINLSDVPHNDGINIDSSQGFRIRDCDVDSGDDALVFKTTSSMPIRDIVVTGCRLKSRQGAIKFGTESVANFEKVRITNCHIRDTRNGGIKLLSVDGAFLQDIVISDIVMDNVATPIFVRLGARLKTFRPGEMQRQVGQIRNVLIRNVRAKAAAQAQIMPPSGIFITGIPGHSVGSLTLENIEIELAGGGLREHGRASVEEKIDVYPEINRFGPRLPAFGLYARHAKNLKVRQLILRLAAADLRPALVCQDCEDAVFTGWKLPSIAEWESLVRLESSQRVLINGFEITGSANTFLRVEGKDTGAIRLMNNKLTGIRKVVDLGAGVDATAVVH